VAWILGDKVLPTSITTWAHRWVEEMVIPTLSKC
jgi:hypothetical protein